MVRGDLGDRRKRGALRVNRPSSDVSIVRLKLSAIFVKERLGRCDCLLRVRLSSQWWLPYYYLVVWVEGRKLPDSLSCSSSGTKFPPGCGCPPGEVSEPANHQRRYHMQGIEYARETSSDSIVIITYNIRSRNYILKARMQSSFDDRVSSQSPV